MQRPRPSQAPASVDDVRRRNLGSLLGLVHARGAISRADLTALTGLNRSTVGALTADLAEAGLVRESAPVGHGRAGRPSIMVEPESNGVYAIALDIGVAHMTALRLGLGGVVLDRRNVEQRGDYTLRSTLTRATRLVRSLLAAAPPGGRCVGIGVGVCGAVSTDDGVVRFAPNLGWVDVPLMPLLARRLATDVPIDVGNDGDLGARAEHLRGVARGLSEVVYIAGEVGIGGGLILSGNPVRGTGGYAGEIGHMVVDPKGLHCRCGRRGCWETQINDAAVLSATGAPEGMSPLEVLEAYAAGERWAQAGVRRIGRALGSGVADLVNIFNPQLIVFGGPVRHVYAATEPIVREALAAALVAPAEQVQLAVAGLGDDAVAVGAAELGFVRLLEDPLGALGRLPVALQQGA